MAGNHSLRRWPLFSWLELSEFPGLACWGAVNSAIAAGLSCRAPDHAPYHTSKEAFL